MSDEKIFNEANSAPVVDTDGKIWQGWEPFRDLRREEVGVGMMSITAMISWRHWRTSRATMAARQREMGGEQPAIILAFGIHTT